VQYYSEAEGSRRKAQAGMELTRTITHRMHVDNSVELIGELLFGHETGLQTLQAVRPAGRVLVDDWACLKSMVCNLRHFQKILQVAETILCS